MCLFLDGPSRLSGVSGRPDVGRYSGLLAPVGVLTAGAAMVLALASVAGATMDGEERRWRFGLLGPQLVERDWQTLVGVPTFLRWGHGEGLGCRWCRISPSGLAGASPWLCGRMSASRCWRSLRHAASYRGCRRGLAAAFRGRPSGAWILALEPLWGPSVLSGQEFPSGLARGSPWLCEPFSGFARFRRCCEVLCSVPA